MSVIPVEHGEDLAVPARPQALSPRSKRELNENPMRRASMESRDVELQFMADAAGRPPPALVGMQPGQQIVPMNYSPRQFQPMAPHSESMNAEGLPAHLGMLCQLCKIRPGLATGPEEPLRSVCPECALRVNSIDGQGLSSSLPKQAISLDPISTGVYNAQKPDGLAQHLVTAVAEVGNVLRDACSVYQRQQQPSAMHKLTSSLAPGEEVRFALATSSFGFESENKSAATSIQGTHKWLWPGHLIMTSQRLLLLTEQPAVSSSLTFGPGSQMNPVEGGGVYGMTYGLHEASWMFPVPLRNLKHVQLESYAGVESRMIMRPRAQGCCSCCPECIHCCCCPTWRLERHREQTETVRHLTLTMGLLLPPWDEKHILKVSVNSQVPLLQLHLFVAQFQNACDAPLAR
jgi:hypothetical protein